ncbi:glycosyl transferase family 1 [Pseudomonas protegens]|uniref:Lipopolysaccharide biosynthesis protein n=1 Tax=Pseudomonas protegens (strain DSM 19095 / LMG 27888 / CFBP 6595 / CHA0) TaxID=1124983 RepID=A0A2C9EMA7_PSEPH|nr:MULTISPECIES: GT4 family glycosyltransferase PelF [Pseudomonas]AGL84790.1 lipopolysaccharide biosynthesis protein [Pseudomonas protegens CHA0]MBP5110771.1 GT4 family glycosyltransferase PelF [Pseudomonas protegens]MBP5117543.1 GT4 family glycosyltransferase PelF [Pseudomonas protegens]MCS4259220.1 glycosyltransferase involved in cell wall biosynthesis [Pseudomonas sp. BIGb0176]MDS9874032.1 GT4 family glycosyltransferase PelF [Pseudomonas protegens]
MKKTPDSTPIADVCLLLEGTWPYVRGGVSSWIHQMILGLPQLQFSVLFIGGQREAYGQRRYEIPANVVHIEEVYLEEAWRNPRHKREAHSASLEELSNLYRYLHNPQKPAAELGIEVLASLAQGRITLDDVLYSRPSWEALTEGYEQHCADPSFVNYFWTLRTMQSPLLMLANAARHMPRARVLHSISTGYAGLVGCILKQLWGCQFLLSEHGIYTKERKIDLAQASWIAESSNQALNDSMDSGSGYIRMLWVRFFERIGHLVYESADQIIALYDGNRQRQIKDGAPPERTQVIPNGIDLQLWTQALEARAEGIAPVVGLIGRVVPIKDVKTFLRAMRGVVSVMPEVEGWIVGPEEEDPEYVAECRSLVASLGLEQKVLFLGFQKIQDILPQLGLMVLTSISEAQPLVILEAWAAGTPVVSSDVGSCRELIEGGEAADRDLGRAGEVVAIADPQATSQAIIDLLRSPARWQSAQAAGLLRVHRYYSERLMLDRYRTLYHTAIGTPHKEAV